MKWWYENEEDMPKKKTCNDCRYVGKAIYSDNCYCFRLIDVERTDKDDTCEHWAEPKASLLIRDIFAGGEEVLREVKEE